MPQVTVKRSARSKGIRIAVHVDGAVVVTASKLLSEHKISEFVERHTDWIQNKVQKASRRTVLRISKEDVANLKIQARDIAAAHLAYFNRHYRYNYKTIRIGAQKSRWGSCSHTGTISFNYKIAVLPLHLANYIIVHELCHVGEMNHSKRFWDLVAQTIPDYMAYRKELRNLVVIVAP